MLTQETLDRIRRFEGASYPVLSVYMNLAPEGAEARSVGARLRDMLKPIRGAADRLDHRARSSLRRDIDSVLELQKRIEADLGHGVAIFASSGRDLLEYVSVPRKVWDSAVADARPYIRPLAAVLDEFHRYAAAIVDRRRSRIFESYVGEFEPWHETVEEGLRRSNFGGWYGLEEYGVRHHAEEVVHRHYRETVALISELFEGRGFEILFIGGHKQGVEGFMRFVPAWLAKRVAGTFIVDPRTATPAIIQHHCAMLEEQYERTLEREVVEKLFAYTTASPPHAVGLARTIDAANARAIDLLLVDHGATSPGVRCEECGWLGIEETSCVRCGGPTQPCVDIVEELVRRTIEDGSSTEHVFADTALRGRLVGALLRFPPR